MMRSLVPLVLVAALLAGCASPEPLPQGNRTGPLDPGGVVGDNRTAPGNATSPPAQPPAPTPPPGAEPWLPGPPVEEARVRVVDDAFRPSDVHLRSGGRAVFTSEGTHPHSVTVEEAGGGGIAFDQDVPPGESVTVSLTAGEGQQLGYLYRCKYHSQDFTEGMVGTIFVSG